MSRPLRLLIVDDEVDTCENLSDILTDMGYVVDLAHDGAAALKLVERNGYDVALLDLRMPGMDGLELYRCIRQIAASTIAIVVTAYARSETAKSVLDAGAWRIVSKPVDLVALLDLLAEAANQPLGLLVDDDVEFCDNIWQILRNRGYRVHLAHNADEAEKALRKYHFHVAIVDMKLPDRDGAEVTNLIRQTGADTRLVLVTGFGEEMKSRIEQARLLGASAVSYKPIDATFLLAQIEEVAQQN
jgi:CheY-like chemotaxis protein